MTTLLITATVAVSLLMLLVWLPEMREAGPLLRRWSRGGDGPGIPGIGQAVDNAVGVFARVHSLPEEDAARVRDMKVRPAMMPVTLLLHPQLVQRENGRFVRGRNLTTVVVGLVVIALIFPPVTGIALHNISLWIFPLLNVAAFVAGVQLVKQAYSDMSLLNVLITGKPD